MIRATLLHAHMHTVSNLRAGCNGDDDPTVCAEESLAGSVMHGSSFLLSIVFYRGSEGNITMVRRG